MITRLVKPSIELKNITINYDKSIEDSNAEDYVSKIGLYPFVMFNGLIIDYKQFVDFKILNDDFTPKLELVFRDYSNLMIDSLFPLDDSIISVYIKSPSEHLQPIRMDFKIMQFNPVKNGISSEDVVYSLVGYLDVTALYFSLFSSHKGTSFEVIKEICKSIGLGFASNVTGTNDAQVWINPANNKKDFIKTIVSSAYRGDESFMVSYIDFYYNLNYIDVEAQFSDSTKGLMGISNDTFIVRDGSNEELCTLLLTNHPDAYSKNNYIARYNILNESTNVNLDIGYFGALRYYKKIERELNIYTVNALSNNANNDTIILKSNSDPSPQNLNNFGGNHTYYGTIDSDNLHVNYHYATIQNTMNLRFLQKVRMKVILRQPNFNLYRFQMIEVKLYKMQEVDSKNRYIGDETVESLAGKNLYEDKLNKRLSGDWMITGINIRFSPSSGWEQEVNLAKRELGVSELKK